MQVSFVSIFAALAGVAMASPMSLHLIRSCDLAKCAIALGPTGVSCTKAVVSEGEDPFVDAGCIAAAVNSVVNTPAACTGCGSAISGAVNAGEKAIGGAVHAGEKAIGGAAHDVKSAFDSIF
ncbi:hypothetical protein JB92DRAFT_3147532 [Gautieria morchelliformis]|nr:hypothetical protein JB92DRAFT_3147532 [Gautieria morchelliformis]